MSIEVLRRIKVRANLEPAFREQLMKSPLKFLQEYDLTEDEKRQIILPNFGWLFENKLAAMAYPESEDAFTLLYRIGIRAVLNLSEPPLPEEVLNTVGLLTKHIPIVDFTAPTLDQVKQAVTMISTCLDRHLPVAVHCIAGLGRTGTILACYLVGMEMPANNAIIIIREWRPGSIEVPEQEAGCTSSSSSSTHRDRVSISQEKSGTQTRFTFLFPLGKAQSYWSTLSKRDEDHDVRR